MDISGRTGQSLEYHITPFGTPRAVRDGNCPLIILMGVFVAVTVCLQALERATGFPHDVVVNLFTVTVYAPGVPTSGVVYVQLAKSIRASGSGGVSRRYIVNSAFTLLRIVVLFLLRWFHRHRIEDTCKGLSNWAASYK